MPANAYKLCDVALTSGVVEGYSCAAGALSRAHTVPRYTAVTIEGACAS